MKKVRFLTSEKILEKHIEMFFGNFEKTRPNRIAKKITQTSKFYYNTIVTTRSIFISNKYVHASTSQLR